MGSVPWQVIPQLLLTQTIWSQPPVRDWRELVQSDFDDLDFSWRTGTGAVQQFSAAIAAPQTSLLDARRTARIEIMLRRIPGATVEEKMQFALHIMLQMLLMRASEVKGAMLAMRQESLSSASDNAIRAKLSRVSEASLHQQPANSILFVLGSDLVSSVLNRVKCVRKVLHFAETSRESYRLVHSGVNWAQMYANLMPPMAGQSSGQIPAQITARTHCLFFVFQTTPTQKMRKWVSSRHAGRCSACTARSCGILADGRRAHSRKPTAASPDAGRAGRLQVVRRLLHRVRVLKHLSLARY